MGEILLVGISFYFAFQTTNYSMNVSFNFKNPKDAITIHGHTLIKGKKHPLMKNAPFGEGRAYLSTYSNPMAARRI